MKDAAPDPTASEWDSHVLGPLREMVSTSENKEEAAGGGGSPKGEEARGLQ